MYDKEAIEMMRRCLQDLEDLRRQRDILAPKAEAYEMLRSVVNLIPKASVGYGEDITWTLKKKIKELEAKSDDAADNN